MIEGLTPKQVVEELDKYIIGQANIELDKNGNIVNERVNAREAGEFILALRSDIPYSSPQNRMIVLDENTLPPYFLAIYSGKAKGISPMSSFGAVSVYKVE